MLEFSSLGNKEKSEELLKNNEKKYRHLGVILI